MMAKGEQTEKKKDRNTCAAKTVDACFYRQKSSGKI
jgi:hypothetical protein